MTTMGKGYMPEFRVRKGDQVRFRLGTRSIQGVVKEDRGPIGVNGRRLYLVEFHTGPKSEYLSQIELPPEQLQSVHDTVSKG